MIERRSESRVRAAIFKAEKAWNLTGEEHDECSETTESIWVPMTLFGPQARFSRSQKLDFLYIRSNYIPFVLKPFWIGFSVT